MTKYLIDIQKPDGKKMHFTIEAVDEMHAVEKMKLRLPPAERDTVDVLSVRIDKKEDDAGEPFGTFLL